MTTDVDIANMALTKLGTRATIASLTENSTEARVINTWYATVRDDLIRSIDWNFARVYQTLALQGTPPARWAYSYAYPSDCVKFWRIDMGITTWFPGDPNTIFEVGSDGTNRMIWTNQETAVGVYSQRVTDPNRMDPEFVTAFVACLAAAVAYPITQKRDIAAQMQADAKAIMEDAMADSANEAVSNDRDRVAETISARGYDYSYAPSWLNGKLY